MGSFIEKQLRKKSGYDWFLGSGAMPYCVFVRERDHSLTQDRWRTFVKSLSCPFNETYELLHRKVQKKNGNFMCLVC